MSSDPPLILDFKSIWIELDGRVNLHGAEGEEETGEKHGGGQVKKKKEAEEKGSRGDEEGRGEEAVETRSAMFPLCGFSCSRRTATAVREREERKTLTSSSVLSIDEAKVTV